MRDFIEKALNCVLDKNWNLCAWRLNSCSDNITPAAKTTCDPLHPTLAHAATRTRWRSTASGAWTAATR